MKHACTLWSTAVFLGFVSLAACSSDDSSPAGGEAGAANDGGAGAAGTSGQAGAAGAAGQAGAAGAAGQAGAAGAAAGGAAGAAGEAGQAGAAGEAGSAGSAGAAGAADGGNPPDCAALYALTITDLTADQRGQLCDCLAVLQGGYGKTTDCGSGVTMSVWDDQAECVTEMPTTCAEKADTAAKCSTEVGKDPCKAVELYQKDPNCKALAACAQ